MINNPTTGIDFDSGIKIDESRSDVKNENEINVNITGGGF